MLSKIVKSIVILLLVLFIFGCNSEVKNRISYPFEVLEIISSKKNKTMSVVIVKTGIKGGATVPFEYEFYFSSDDKDLSKNKLFLVARGLDEYKINWSSVNTINLNIRASRIIMFRSTILIKSNKISNLYYVNKFNFKNFAKP